MSKHFIVMGAAALLMSVMALVAGFSNKPPETRLTQLQALELPPDGLELYQTLLQEIPEVVSQVPCACCKKMLSTCYEGFCPPT